jgi:diacylglycerol diphosphate phosphatase/phosphatidate phosphatase
MEAEGADEEDEEGLLPRRSTRLADEANPRPSEEEVAWRNAAGSRRA